MNPQTKCCGNCVHARWKYRELGSIDRDSVGCCLVNLAALIRPICGTLCESFEPSANPVTEESKRMKAAVIEVRKLAEELWFRFSDATKEQRRLGLAGNWKRQSNTLELAAEILEQEAD